MPARFYQQDVHAKLPAKRKLSTFLDNVVQQKPGIKTVQLNYIFCNDVYLLQLNKEFLHHDTFTDIVTFDLSETPGSIQGEIYISTERVWENAGKFGVTYTNELHRVIFHGALHLCGYKDKTIKDKAMMRAKEDDCLARYFKG